MRLLTQNHGRLQASGIVVVGVVCQNFASVTRWITANPLPFPLLVDERREVARAYGVHYWLSAEGFNLARPSLFVLDAGGQITFRYVGRNMRDLPVTTVLERFVGLLGNPQAPAASA
jgi:peroxiredoxin